MPVERSYARLGFFIAVATLVVLVTAVFFIQRLKSRPAFGMVTYTTENVFGLDVSSAVRLRGVPVGQVTDIRVDPHGTVVEIDFEVYLDRLSNIGLDVKRLRTITDIGGVFPNLRAQLMGNPMTGQAYLLLDQPRNPPPPMELAFKPSRPYVPSVASPFAMVEDRLPQLLDRADTTLNTLTEIIAKMPESIDHTNQFFTKAERVVQESQLPELSADTRKFYTTTGSQIEQIRSEMDGVIGPDGTLVKASEEMRAAIKAADLPATTRSTREAEDTARLASEDLRRSLTSVRNSADQLRELTHQIQEEPESFIYGRRPPARSH